MWRGWRWLRESERIMMGWLWTLFFFYRLREGCKAGCFMHAEEIVWPFLGRLASRPESGPRLQRCLTGLSGCDVMDHGSKMDGASSRGDKV